MERIIVDDGASASYLMQLKERIDNLEQNGMGVDEQGNVVTVSADQIVNAGTEIGGITIGGTRTAFYAPNVDIPEATAVTITPLTNEGVKIANIKVDDTLHSLYAPKAKEVSVQPELVHGTKIATITVGNETKTLYAPEVIQDETGATVDLSGKLDAPAVAGSNGQVLATDGNGNNYWTNMPTSSGGGTTIITGEGDGPYPLLNSVTLAEDVSSIIFSEDSNGNQLNIADGFYIEAEFEAATTNPATVFCIYLGDSNSNTNVPVCQAQSINTNKGTYAEAYVKQIAPNRWMAQVRSKNTMYEIASGLGTSVGNLGYNNWNGYNNPPAIVNRVVIKFNTNNYGKNSVIKLFGR